eukprot:916636-Prymnesium_polylepis.1
MAQNSLPRDWATAQMVLDAEKAELRERGEDERTSADQEIVHTKFICATAVGVRPAAFEPLQLWCS